MILQSISKIKLFFICFVMCFVLFLSLFWLFQKTNSSVTVNNSIVDTFEAKMTAHQGEVIYLDFWSSWCIPCRDSFPWMNQLQSKYQALGLKVITINLDHDKNNALEFLNKYPANFDIIYDPQGQIAKQFKLKGMPSSFIFDRNNKLVSRHAGFTQEQQQSYEQELLTLLSAK